jgi:hypothetical protein
MIEGEKVKLPKMYRVVEVEFWSLRTAYGEGFGAYEADVCVTRKARRVSCDDGWKWQIICDECLPFSAEETDTVCINEPDSIESIIF